MKVLSTLIFSTLFFTIFSQQISVLTCDKGAEIYSTFGHTAIRVIDSSKQIDYVYNYGLFEFSDPNFIPKFCMGKLDYMVGKENFSDFLAQYQYQQRGVEEQVLNLTETQKDSLLKFLEWNILPQNKMYRYDFLFNNCATKIIEILEKNCVGLKMEYYKDESPLSFRQLIHRYAKNSVPFIDWGMDVALGISTDQKATPRQYTFLPDFVQKSLDLSSNQSINQRLVLTQNQILPKISSTNTPNFFSPSYCSVILIGLFLFVRNKSPWYKRFLQFIFFFILGIGGFVVGFEWFATEHSVTKLNFNLLWLNPLSLIYSFIILFDIQFSLRHHIRKFIGLCAFLCIFSYFIVGQCYHMASYILMFLIVCLAALDIKIMNNKVLVTSNSFWVSPKKDIEESTVL